MEEVDGEVLVLDDENGYIHQLNDTASFVWRQIDGKTCCEEIAKRLADSFEVELADAARDVEGLIEKFRELNLLCE